MMTAYQVSQFSIYVENGAIHARFRDDALLHLLPREVRPFLSGQVTGDEWGTACLSNWRLVLTAGPNCAVLLFTTELYGEFVSQLSALDVEEAA